MAKITLTDLTSLANDTSAVNSINNNFQAVEDYINDNVLSRDTGAEINTMQNDLDMNSFDILNGGSARFSTVIVDGVVASAGTTFSDARWTAYTSPSSSFDSANGNVQVRTAAANEEINITLASDEFSILVIKYIPGAFTITFGSTIDKWIGGSAPSTVEAEHWMAFWSEDGGSTIVGQSIGGAS